MSDDASSNASLPYGPFDVRAACPRNTRAERRARKMLLRNSQKCLGDVSRVVFRLEDGTLYAINKPNVYKNMHLNTYLVFGCLVKLDNDFNELEDLKVPKATFEIQQNLANFTKSQEFEDKSTAKEIKDINETGLNNLDIELVMSQAGVTRVNAVMALRKNNNDLVNTIMDLVQ